MASYPIDSGVETSPSMSPECKARNLSAVLVKPGQIQMQYREVPEPKPDEVQVQVKVTGICGSDVHYWLHGRIADFVVQAPMVLGHESSGIVTAVGSEVHDLKVGDNVAIEPGVTCRRCEFCKKGRYNLCPDIVFAATPPYDGTLCNYITYPSDFCFRVPDNVSLEEAALVEPLSVAVHAVQRAELDSGRHVMVFGSGPIGLLVSAVARAAGSTRVTVADIIPSRLEFAKEYAATETVLLQRPAEGESNLEFSRRTVKHIREELNIPRADVVFDCTGAEPCVQMAIGMAKNGGKVLLVGMGNRDQQLPIMDAAIREVDIKGTFRYCNTYPRALQMISSGLVDVKPLITHRFSLADAPRAFEAVKNGQGIKVQILG
ncbi:uncharacterized protein VTP21DRAFT_2647 [Calcarisporiella thermophila]|uniref:uncharacterized protein n=1 Tax=Calcarisporiella thermophila TaxID=911321 RepID=UPI003742D768